VPGDSARLYGFVRLFFHIWRGEVFIMANRRRRANLFIGERLIAESIFYAIEPLEARILLSGVTLIAPGFGDNVSGWVTQMADAIITRAGLGDDATVYTVSVTDPNPPAGALGGQLQVVATSQQGPDPDKSADPEIFILLDWSSLSGSLSITNAYSVSTSYVAAAVAKEFLVPNFLPGLAAPIASLPIDLIGHSRGGSLVSGLAADLGASGVWVDQVTTLDPFPIVGDYGYSTNLEPTNNVVFADNYFQDTLPVIDGYNVFGATSLGPLALPGGYGFPAYQHANVHEFYYGTIDLSRPTYDSPNDTGQELSDNTWYSGNGVDPSEIGYYYTRLAGGTRPASGLWSSDNRAPVALTISGANVWDNVMISGFTGGSFAQGSTITISPAYGDGNGDASITMGFDTDQNPYDGGTLNTQTQHTAYGVTFALSTSGLPIEQPLYVYAKITNGTTTRYYYAPETIILTPPPAADTTPPTATLSFPANGSTVSQSLINSTPQYIDVTFNDTGGSGLNLPTITDAGEEFYINGITINGAPTLVSGTTYRYSFTGTIPLGTTDVNFLAGAWADNAGNLNQAFTQTFTVSSQPVITAVTPSVLLPLPADETQLITISGSGFSANSTLNFVSALGNSYTGRVPTYNSATGQLSYYVSVGTAQGQWSVQVVTNGVASDPFYFTVSSASPVATPTISPNGGSYSNSVQVNLSTTTSGATIRYTLDGSTPTASSAPYTGPLTLSTSVTLNAIGFEAGVPNSAMASAIFNVTIAPLAPVITSVSPTLLQPSNNAQFISIYGTGFLPGAAVYLYVPSGSYYGEATTTYVSSGWLDCELNVAAQSGTWTVVEMNNPPSGQSSNSFSFTVAQPPTGNYPTPLSPSNGATNQSSPVTVSWQAVPGMSGNDSYRVMDATTASALPTDPNALGLVGGGWVSGTSYTNTQMTIGGYNPPGQTYYWEVQASINGVRQAWSPIWSYTIAGELIVPPVIQSAAVTPTTVTQGDTLTFTASGVSDPNPSPDYINYVAWYVESNGVPGLQTSINGGDYALVSDTDGSDGWSASYSTFGLPSSIPLAPGTHTVYGVAVNSTGLFSAATPPFTITILPANVPAPIIENVAYVPGASSAAIKLTFNTQISPNLPADYFQISGPGNPQISSVSYDADSNTVTLDLATATLANGDYQLSIPFPNVIVNAAGVSLQGQTSYAFTVLAGDANGDRTVDSQDYTILLQNLNTGAGKGWANGDFNGDGVVDNTDLQILEANMGQTLPPLAGAPNQPVNSSPSDGLATVALAPILQASAFSDPNAGNTEAAADWVVTRLSDSIVVFNSGQDPTDLTNISLGSLAYSTTYSWKVRYLNNLGVWSAYSNPTTFTTQGPPVLASDTWTGSTSGDWYNPGNWSAEAIPAGVTNVAINSGTVTVTYPFAIGSLSLNGGTLQLGYGSASETYSVSSLTISNGGKLDIGDNELIINFGSNSDPKTAILQSLASGYNGGNWNGPGIDSSAAAVSKGAYGVGFADGTDGVVQGLSNGQIELKYTLNGDANLDGLVNAADFTIVAGNFNRSVTGWDQGDFNYDGLVNAADFTDLAANFNQGANLNAPGLVAGSGAIYSITGSPGAQMLDILSGTVTLTSDLSALLPDYSLKIENGASVVLASDQHIGALQVDGSGSLDVRNYTMFINYGSNPDPVSVIAGYIKSGYNGGHWNGPGIISTTAQTKTNGLQYGIGYADGKDGVVSGLPSGQIEVKYTLSGDANLDGLVNAADFTILAANFNQSVTGWDHGDFNYDGLVNAADFTDLAANFNQGASGASVASAAPVLAVPVVSIASTVTTSTTKSTAANTAIVTATLTAAKGAAKSASAAPTAPKSKPIGVSKVVISDTSNKKAKASTVTAFAASVVPTAGSTATPQNSNNKDAKLLADR
jgi:hypothetical protein